MNLAEMSLKELIELANQEKWTLKNTFDKADKNEIKAKIQSIENYITNYILNNDIIYVVYSNVTKAPYIDAKDNMWIFTEFKLAKNIIEYSKRKNIDLYLKEITRENNVNYWAFHLFFNGIEKILLNNGKNPYELSATKFYNVDDKNVLENANFVYYYLKLLQEQALPDDSNKKIKLKTLTDNIIDEFKTGNFILPLKESMLEEELEEIPFEAVPFVEKNGFKQLPLYTDWIKFEKAYPSGYVGIILTGKDINDILQTQSDIFSLIINYKSYTFIPDVNLTSQLINEFTRSINLKRSMYINEDIQKAIKRVPNLAHRVSQPVIYQEGKNFYLASFVFFYSREDIKKGVVDRPTQWIKMDLETGKVLNIYDCKEHDFSDAEYGKTYDVTINNEYDTSQYYYENTFVLLDDIRLQILNNEKINILKYMLYIERNLTSIPDDYKRFYFDLSIPCPRNTTGYLMPSDTYKLFDYITKYKSSIEENTEMKFIVGVNPDYRLNTIKSIYKDWSDPEILLEYVYYPIYLQGNIDIEERIKSLIIKFLNSDVPLAFFQSISFIETEKRLLKKYKTLPFTIGDNEIVELIEKQIEKIKPILLKYTKKDSKKSFIKDDLYEESLMMLQKIKDIL